MFNQYLRSHHLKILDKTYAIIDHLKITFMCTGATSNLVIVRERGNQRKNLKRVQPCCFKRMSRNHRP